MSPTGWPYALIVAATIVICWQIYRDIHRRRTLGRFSALLDSDNRRLLERLAVSAATAQAIVRDATEEARVLWPEEPQVARERLRIACEHVERVAVPRFLETLIYLRRLARTVKVFPPPRPLARAAFQLLRTRGWAALASLLHCLGLTGRSRIRVRLWFLKRALISAARVFTGTAKLAIEEDLRPPRYATLTAAAADLKLAQDETVVTAQHILDAFARWQEYRRQQR